jgi:putative acyl-CoA dehydrogenase
MLPRLYREAPVNAIWEGSGNVMCLDVLRALGQDREAARAALAALAEETADLPDARAALDFIARAAAEDAEGEARSTVDRLALLAAAAALRQSAPEVAALFARTRLEQGHGAMYGTSRIGADEARRLIDRALPPV